MFPLWIENKIRLDINEIEISSEKYLINQIENYLGGLDLRLIKKTDNKLIFYKGEFMHRWRRKDFINNGLIKIIIKDNYIIIKIKSLIAGAFLFCCLIAFAIYIDNPTKPAYWIIILVFVWLYGANYLIRFFAHRKLKREIKEIILNL